MLKLAMGNYKVSYRDSLPLILLNRLSHVEGIFPSTANRKTHAYCIGLPRSGTHFLADFLGKKCKAVHEPMKKETINFIVNKLASSSKESINKWLLLRDKLLRVDVEASHFTHYFAGNLCEIFPEAKFILTIRNPIDWLESELTVNYSASKSVYWRALEEHRYNLPSLTYEPIDRTWQPSRRRIEAYIRYWNNHIEQTIISIPKNRLLVVNTNELNNSLSVILDFLNLDPSIPQSDVEKKGARKQKAIKLSEHTVAKAHEIIKRTCNSISLISETYL